MQLCRVEGLMLLCLFVVTGKTPEEIRKTFNIPNDFSPEEEEEVRRENQCVILIVIAFNTDSAHLDVPTITVAPSLFLKAFGLRLAWPRSCYAVNCTF